jgi:hypothetical protein
VEGDMGEEERGRDERVTVGNDYVHRRQTGQTENGRLMQRRSSFYLSWKLILLSFHMIDCPACHHSNCRPSFMSFEPTSNRVLYGTVQVALTASCKYDKHTCKNIMANVGIEPKTFALLARRSNQLS